MTSFKKNGSMLIRNLFFILIIFVVIILIYNFQSVNLKSLNSVVLTKKINNPVDIIKNELHFNKQYLHITNKVYINEENLERQTYKELRELFEIDYDVDKNFFCIESNLNEGEITIKYFKKQELIFIDKLEI